MMVQIITEADGSMVDYLICSKQSVSMFKNDFYIFLDVFLL